MPTNKNAQLRYKILDRCFRNKGRKYFIEDLVSECNKALRNIESHGVKKRQTQHDIEFMKSAEGWGIVLDENLKEGKRRYYRYADPSFSIYNIPLDESEVNRLQTTLQTLSQFKGMPQFEWMYEILLKLKQGKAEDALPQIMEFENNQDLKGIEHISMLYDAIVYKKVLTINYLESFKEEKVFEIHPYYLKQYNNRWFLFGYNPEYEKYNWNLSLDRMVKIKEIQKPHIPNIIDWGEYFNDIMGVTKPDNLTPEKIVLNFYGKTAHYIESKPMHPYQKKPKWLDSETLEVKLELIVNYELERFILSYADSVKVIQPQSLAEKIKERIKGAWKLNVIDWLLES